MRQTRKERRQALVGRGRRWFVWRARLRPIGLPLAGAAALLAWRRGRSRERAALAAATTFGLVCLEAVVEFEFQRAASARSALAERRQRREAWRAQTDT